MSQAVDFKRDACILAESLEANSSTDWLEAFRRASLGFFQQSAFPNRKTEHYKYNNLTALQRQHFSSMVDAAEDEVALPTLINPESSQYLVFIDGIYSQVHSKIDGYRLTAFSETNAEQQTLILDHIGANIESKSFFHLLNDSLTHDGILIETEDGKAHQPLHLVYINTSASQNKTSLTNLVVHIKQQSQATLIEHFDARLKADEKSLSNNSTQFILGKNAVLNHYRFHLEPENQLHLGHLAFWLGADAQLNTFHIGLGGELKRTDINVYHQATGSHAEIQGVYLSGARQQIDYHTNVQHQKPHCTTNEVFRGIVGGRSKAVFNGRIHIFPNAQKTLAKLSNKNLLLSKQAEVDTKPELEIYADDVQCAHGATVSQMNEDALFYLRSRGVSKEDAKLILSFGFINEVLDTVGNQEVADYLRPTLVQFFNQLV